MKKIIKVICFSLLLTFAFSTAVNAEEKCVGWYINKNGCSTPGFPSEASLVTECNGYFIDTVAASNGEKIIYLTFDAGYENGNVSRTVDILDEKGVKGAFFLLSQIISKNPETVRKMFDGGHTVCNHTKNHKNMATLNRDEMKSNLEALEALCLEKTGYQMRKYFRFPEGKFSERTMRQADEFGYTTFFWSLAYADWDNSVAKNDNVAMKKILEHTHPGCILLLHPTSDINVRILPRLIDEWRNMGYSFGTLDELVERNTR